METRDQPADQGKPAAKERSSEVSEILDRNINALLDRRTKDEQELSREDKIAGAIGGFAGSMRFIYLHLLVFSGWIAINLGWLPLVPVFDPSLVILAMAASVEAIFISTFVMINQNRMARQEDKRAELSLQISLLSEHETTKLLGMVSAITKHLDIPVDVEESELEELKRSIPPETVLEEIERAKDAGSASSSSSSAASSTSS